MLLGSRKLTDALLAGVGQMVVAGHISPAAIVMPHHHSTVLAGKEVAVGLPFVPVLIQLTDLITMIKKTLRVS